MLCLDNSVLRKYSQPSPDSAVVAFLKERKSRDWVVPSLVAFEFYRPVGSPQELLRIQQGLHRIVDDILPVDEDAVTEAIDIENSLAKADTSLDVVDLLHVATSEAAGATFVTTDAGDFDKVPIRELLDVEVIHV